MGRVAGGGESLAAVLAGAPFGAVAVAAAGPWRWSWREMGEEGPRVACRLGIGFGFDGDTGRLLLLLLLLLLSQKA
jgi:hypothetical protein